MVIGELPTGVVTFLFTDVEGSTPLLARLGAAYRPLLDAHERIIREALAAHRGVEVKTEGDAFFAAFGDAADALGAALDAQRALAAHPWPEGGRIRVRMGLHTGEAQPAGGDYIAIAVNLAARVSAAAHGGQVVTTEPTAGAAAGRVPAGASLVPVGRFRFKGFSEPVAVLELRHPDIAQVPTALRALPAAAHNFRPDRTTFLGRGRELEKLGSLLGEGRPVTLTGPGGCGKTRLAREFAVQTAADIPEGAWFVDLTPLPSGDDVAPAVAHELGVRADGTKPVAEAIRDELAERRLLLVLDNCEHVLDSAAGLVDELAACPGVALVATSRERLGVPGEIVWPVPPLADDDAEALFAERALAARPGVTFEEADAAAVTAICRRLDGLPLAIELAAVRVGAGMRPAQVLDRLERRFYLLEGGARTARPGHRTLRAVVEWSYELLEEPERAVLRRLAVFAGSFSLEAAEAVCHGQAIPISDVALHLGGLVDKSLVLVEEDGRYRLLETIREYGRLQLAAALEGDEAYARHLHWVGEIAERRDDETEEEQFLDRLESEFNELRAAIERAIESGAGREALHVCLAAGRLFTERWHVAEGHRWLTALLAALPELPPAERAAALLRLGAHDWRLGDYDAARATYAEALELAEAAGDEELALECLIGAGNADADAGDLEAAERSWMRALPLLDAPGREEKRWILINNLAYGLYNAGRMEESRAWFERLRADGGDRLFVRSMVHTGMFDLAIADGDEASFRREVLGALAAHVERDDVVELAYAINAVALAAGAGEEEMAARMLGAARAAIDAVGVTSPPVMDGREERARQRLSEALGETAFADAWRDGEAMSLIEATAVASALVERASAPARVSR